MTKYIKRPIVIEAFRLADKKRPEWAIEAFKTGVIKLGEGCKGVFIMTLEGVMYANEDDYIIQGINKEIYPCKPDIFEKTYKIYGKESELVEESLSLYYKSSLKEAGDQMLRDVFGKQTLKQGGYVEITEGIAEEKGLPDWFTEAIENNLILIVPNGKLVSADDLGVQIFTDFGWITVPVGDFILNNKGKLHHITKSIFKEFYRKSEHRNTL